MAEDDPQQELIERTKTLILSTRNEMGTSKLYSYNFLESSSSSFDALISEEEFVDEPPTPLSSTGVEFLDNGKAA